MQRNFILTDLMKTGFHQEIESFVNCHSMVNQSFDMTGEYYTLHGYDLDSYDRKFAIIDRSTIGKTHPSKSTEYREELEKRRRLLHSQGFVFILATPWESKENIDNLNLYPQQIDEFIWDGGVSWFWFYMWYKHKDRQFTFDHSKKKFDYLYLNKMQREHRKRLFMKISETNILENSLYTNWPDRKLPLEYELPWAQHYPFYGMDQEIYEKPYNDTKYSLISESNSNNTDVFITEKLWKAIIAQHIFVVHGNYLYLQKLREIGFKTFSQWIDESYDIELDDHKRIESIVRVCDELRKANWKDLYLQSQSIRKHNLDTLFNKDKLSIQVNKTLNLFLEFADSR